MSLICHNSGGISALNCLISNMKNPFSRNPLKPLMTLVFTVLLGTQYLQAQDGEKIFKQNCAVCHDPFGDRTITGPGLKGLFDRAPGGDWLKNWILNNQKLIKAGDPYAVKVYNQYGKATMNVFEGQLTDKDVEAVIGYLKKGPPVADVTTTPTGGGAAVEEQAEGGIAPLYLVLGVIVILAILLVTLRSIRTSLQNSRNRASGLPDEPEVTFWQESRNWIANNRRLVGVLCIIVVFVGMKGCWDACYDIGVYYDWETGKGYKPEQPIKFSHKLHAGDNQIACQYCHSGVEKSRHAGIPSVNICMNCHKGISSGPQYKEAEIAKIYKAAGFNPTSGKYDESKQSPLKWIKVHNLPDHVYFNHSQHVVVGGIDCATCHGDVKSMTVAEQKAPLTMKWCIECHRTTEVAMEGNAYYDRLHKALKEKYAGQLDVRYTVEKIGGLECSKCHY
jgi:mono/diheme cytochrome c family protein